MKVIGGTARGRKLKVPKGLAVRPTAARVKESLFNILRHDFSGLRVLDLYAGSGNVSIEALSRGAVEAVLVDESARSAAVIRENLTRLELIQRAQIWIVPVARALRKLDKAGKSSILYFSTHPMNEAWSKRPWKPSASALCSILTPLSSSNTADGKLSSPVMASSY